MTKWIKTVSVAALVAVGVWAGAARADVQLLNVSYDPTRELYEQYDKAFAAHWKQTTGEAVSIKQSHGGSGKQARSVLDGLAADVVTLGIATDVDALASGGLVATDWRARLPDDSVPYYSTIVFVVRKGNPKQIKDWPDLVKGDTQIVTPNPKSSSAGRWAYLAAYGAALKANGNDGGKAKAFASALYQRVPKLDAGARGATLTFARDNIGDVLLAWENEAYLARQEFGADAVEIVTPPTSILAEPPVAVVDQNVDQHGTRKQAEAYLQWLYSSDGQQIIAANHYRPRDKAVAQQHAADFPAVNLFTAADVFGGLAKAQQTHFADGGVFDQIYTPGQ